METLRYRWILLAKSYLALAKAGVEKIEKDINYNKNHYMSCAVVFNIKHSIELILKSLLVTASESYAEVHDLHKLSMLLKSKVKTKSKNLTKLIEISEKYHKLDFWNGKLAVEGYFDGGNEAFRFPTATNAKYLLDLQKIKDLEKRDIVETRDDIRVLEIITPKAYKIIRKGKMTISPDEEAQIFADLCYPRRARGKSVSY